MYIGAQREETVSGLAPGTYLLRFLLGRDWDPKNRTFLQGRSFYQAGKQLEFIETETDSGGQYTELNLTLNEVPGGNLPRDRITEAALMRATRAFPSCPPNQRGRAEAQQKQPKHSSSTVARVTAQARSFLSPIPSMRSEEESSIGSAGHSSSNLDD